MLFFRTFALGTALITASALGCGSAKPAPTTTPATSASAPIAASSTSASVATPAPPEHKSLDIKALLARDTVSGTFTEHPVAIPEIGYQGSVLGSGAAVIDLKDKAPKVSIPVGSEGPVVCWVRSDNPAPGSLIGAVRDSVVQTSEKHEVIGVDAGVDGDAPYVALNFLYRKKAGERVVVGEVKLMAFARAADTLLCMHDEIGYHEAFKASASSLAAKFTNGKPIPNLLEHYVFITQAGSARLGFANLYVFGTAGKELKSLTRLASVLPKSATEVSTSDSVSTYTWDNAGELAEYTTVALENSEVRTQVKLVRVKGKGRRYATEGEVAGKPVKTEFDSPAAIVNELTTRASLKRVFGGKTPAKEHIEVGYEPSIDPMGISKTVMKPVAPNTFDVTTGGTTERHTVDDAYRPLRIVTNSGSVEIINERVYFKDSSK